MDILCTKVCISVPQKSNSHPKSRRATSYRFCSPERNISFPLSIAVFPRFNITRHLHPTEAFDLPHQTSSTMDDVDELNLADNELPISLRRKRRSGVGATTRLRSNSQTSVSLVHGISTPPATPSRPKKRVRFSEPRSPIGPRSESTGLTPFIRKSSLSTPSSKRRHTSPAAIQTFSQQDAPTSGSYQFQPLRDILEARAIRRLRRNGLSEEINKIEWEKRYEAKSCKRDVERLRQELEEKDLEMQSMRAQYCLATQVESESGVSFLTNGTLGAKVHELQQEIVDLKAALQDKESAIMEDPNWTMAARDPFNFHEDDDLMITDFDQDFRDSTMNDDLMTTPTRLRTSFPSPPATMPNTPCKLTSTISTGTQASLSFPEEDALKSQLDSLQSEISKLTAKIAFHEETHARLTGKLSEFLPIDESQDHSSLDSALDTVLTQLALSQAHSLEQSNAFSALGSEITKLGFSSCSGPDEMITAIATQFRQARLDLEYLTPGEVVEGFENEKLLGMLISRIRVLLQKIKERDDSIDQYHEQEISLRQQLNTRVDALEDVQKELSVSKSVADDLRNEILEKDVSNERLQTALQGYRDEVSGLEKLIERMEREEMLRDEMLKGEIKDAEGRLQNEILRHDTTRATAEGKDIINVELERRLSALLQAEVEVKEQMATLEQRLNGTLQAEAEVKEQMVALAAEQDSTIKQLKIAGREREKAHGDALALRDARVSELREEIKRINEALKEAYSNSLTSERKSKRLEARLEGRKTRRQNRLEQINHLVEAEIEDNNASPQRLDGQAGDQPVGSLTVPNAVVRRSGLFDAGSARRGKKRRRYDSGIGFLEEEDDDPREHRIVA